MNIIHIIKLFWLYHLYEKLEYDFPVSINFNAQIELLEKSALYDD